MFDSHAHLNFNTFKNDASEIINNCLERNIRIINIGSQYDTSLQAVKMASEYDKGVYAAIGIHPIHLSQTEVEEEEMHFTSREERFDRKKYEELLASSPCHFLRQVLRNGIRGRQDRLSKERIKQNNLTKSPLERGQGRVVAIGEIGLDYFHIPNGRDLGEIKAIQKEVFIEQLKFARDMNLPVILHCRGAKNDPFGAYHDIIDMLGGFGVKREEDKKNRKGKKMGICKGEGRECLNGVIHCFAANFEIAQQFLYLGFYIGFTGIITFKNASQELLEVVKKIPLDRILVETDCPYLAPVPHRGEQCIPQYVEFTLRKIAELKGVDFKEAERITDGNVEKLFGIGN